MTDAPPPPAGDEPFEPWLDVFPPDKPPNELLIGLCAGRDLAIRDTSVFTKGGSSDPRCVFSIKDRPDLKCQSTVKKKNLNPVYGETFSFELGADELEAPTLHVRCEDYDVGSAPDSMGIFDVKLRGKENKRKRKWYVRRRGTRTFGATSTRAPPPRRATAPRALDVGPNRRVPTFGPDVPAHRPIHAQVHAQGRPVK